MIPRTWVEAEPPPQLRSLELESTNWLTQATWCPGARSFVALTICYLRNPPPQHFRIGRLLWPLAKHQWEEEVSSSGALHWFHAVKEAQQRAHIHSKILSIRSPDKAIWSRETDHPSASNVCLNRENHQALELCECAAREHISRGKDKTPPLRRADENAIWIIN